MKLQIATRIGLYAILELADQPDQQMSRIDIARKFGISSNHLSKVMRELGKAKLVEAVRGVGGGYRFCGNARRITVMDVINIFEPFQHGSTAQREPGHHTEIGKALDVVLDEIDETVQATLHSISLHTMLMIKRRQQPKNNTTV